MQLVGLQRFIEIAEAGSYYQAEKNGGGISSQAYSKLVSSLEQELGVRLVKASRKGVELTPEGAVFLEFARSTVESYKKLQARFRDARKPARPKPPVVYASFYAAAVISELIPQGLIPSDIRVSEESFDAILNRAANLRENEIALVDIQDGSGFEELRSNGLSFRNLINCKPMVALSEESALAKLNRNLEISDLWGMRIVCNSHPEMQHKYRKIIGLLPRETEINKISSVRGLWQYLHMNPDCVFLADSLQAALMVGADQAVGKGFVFLPIDTNLSHAKLGIVQVSRKKSSSELIELSRTLSDVLTNISARDGKNPSEIRTELHKNNLM